MTKWQPEPQSKCGLLMEIELFSSRNNPNNSAYPWQSILHFHPACVHLVTFTYSGYTFEFLFLLCLLHCLHWQCPASVFFISLRFCEGHRILNVLQFICMPIRKALFFYKVIAKEVYLLGRRAMNGSKDREWLWSSIDNEHQCRGNQPALNLVMTNRYGQYPYLKANAIKG